MALGMLMGFYSRRPLAAPLLSSAREYIKPLERNSASRLETGFELEFLGTSSSVSTLTRNVSSLSMNIGGASFLFDCGEGTVRQLVRSYVKPSQIQAVFITHLHGDHFYGLPGLGMSTIGMKDTGKKIKIVAPRGLRSMYGRAITQYTIHFYMLILMSFSYTHFDLHDVQPPIKMMPHDEGTAIKWSPSERAYHCYDHPLFTVRAAPIRHSIFCLGYVIQEKEKRGSILAEKLKADHGLEPGPIFQEISNNATVTLPSGTVINCADYVLPKRKGRKIAILGDTFDPRGIAELAMDADVLVHEATCTDTERTVAIQHAHSTAGMAGAFAKAIRAKHLILTHFSPRNFHSNEFEEVAHMQTLIQQAQAAFGSPNVYAAEVNHHSQLYIRIFRTLPVLIFR